MIRDLRELHTHESVLTLVRDLLEKHGGRLGAQITRHRYESTSPDGAVFVLVARYESSTSIPYGLPETVGDITEMVLAALEPPAEWKSQHRRGWAA